MKTLPSILNVEDGKIRDKMEQFYFTGNTPSLMDAQSFHRLKFNDSIIIRMKHTHYKYNLLFRRDCVITFAFLDEKESEIFGFIIIPGAAEFQLVCANQDPVIGTFSDNDYEKYYEFILIFSKLGIMLFYMDEFNIKATHCVNRITDISKFKHAVKETTNFEAVMEMRSENVRIPDDWHVVKHIPIDHKISIRYFPDVKSIITVRLTDRNGIVALTVTIDHKTG
ncbi:unnamed protein product, partial [Onchocerca ochengi]|uniref:DUF4968 domain-containing protein n=1 Tax=Onchocerca ochengi TaxID=42157 RepID=A0A182EI80_ONCOC